VGEESELREYMVLVGPPISWEEHLAELDDDEQDDPGRDQAED
jgi:hypothetical protein